MRSICTSLGAWGTIETGKMGRHKLTFPLALVIAEMERAGYPAPICWEGDERPVERARDVDLLLLSAMDSRHFWEIAPFLRDVGCPVLSVDRCDADPIVILGGQAATAPAPVEHMVDVVFVGEAEAGLVDLLAALEGDASRARRMERAAALPGVLVPSHMPEGHVVRQVYAEDIGASLRARLQVNLRPLHRMEIARGCRHKCGFCSLGWRMPYREAPTPAILDALTESAARGVRCVHLSAADAESHSGIGELRAHVARLGLRDHGWTGRADEVAAPSVSAGKQFAFGIEGASHRLRAAVGKPKLTDDAIVDTVSRYWAAGGRMLMFHMIGGLPTEGRDDIERFSLLLAGIDAHCGHDRQYLQIGRQPFGPLPHTPMQWFAPGLSTTAIGSAISRHIGGSRLHVTDKSGQPFSAALVNAVVMRGGVEVQPLLTSARPRIYGGKVQARLRWWSWLTRAGLDPRRYISEWSPDEPTPWSHIQSAHPLATLQRAHAAIRRRLGI